MMVTGLGGAGPLKVVMGIDSEKIHRHVKDMTHVIPGQGLLDPRTIPCSVKHEAFVARLRIYSML